MKLCVSRGCFLVLAALFAVSLPTGVSAEDMEGSRPDPIEARDEEDQIFGHLVNTLVTPREVERYGPERAGNDGWVLYTDRLETVPIVPGDKLAEVAALMGKGVRIWGFWSDAYVTSQSNVEFRVLGVEADPAHDVIQASGRIVYEGPVIGPGGEAPTSTFLVADTPQGAHRIGLEWVAEEFHGREVLVSGYPFLSEPSPTMDIQEFLFYIDEIELLNDVSYVTESTFENAFFRQDGEDGYRILDMDSLMQFPVEIDLVEDVATGLVGRVVTASVGVHSADNGPPRYQLTSIAANSGTGRNRLPVWGQVRGALIRADVPGSDGRLFELWTLDGQLLRLPNPAAGSVEDAEGSMIYASIRWFPGSEGEVVYAGGRLEVESVSQDRAFMRWWSQPTLYGWLMSLADTGLTAQDGYVLILPTGEAVRVDTSRLVNAAGGDVDSVIAELEGIIDLGGFVRANGHLPIAPFADREGFWVSSVDFVPGVGGPRFYGLGARDSSGDTILSVGRASGSVDIRVLGPRSRQVARGLYTTISGDVLLEEAPYGTETQPIILAYY